jgi:ABC-2 type transport system permease protein
MLNQALLQQIKVRWLEFKREPSALGWVVFMPIFWMVILGYAFSNPKPEIYGIGVIEGERLGGVTLSETLEKSTRLKVRIGSFEELEKKFRRGEISILVSAPVGQLHFELDPNNPEALRARSFVDDLLQRSQGRVDTITSTSENRSVRGGRYVDFLIPGLLGLSIMSTGLFGVGMSIVSNRKENLLKRYLATPMRPGIYLLSHIFGRCISLAIEFVAIIGSGFLIFGFAVEGNWLAFLTFSVLGAACFTSLAMLCAARTKSIATISGVANLFAIFMTMSSGVFFSKNNFPDSVQPVLDLIPLTALNDALRKIALEGAGFSENWAELLVLCVFTAVCGILARWRFRFY